MDFAVLEQDLLAAKTVRSKAKNKFVNKIQVFVLFEESTLIPATVDLKGLDLLFSADNTTMGPQW